MERITAFGRCVAGSRLPRQNSKSGSESALRIKFAVPCLNGTRDIDSGLSFRAYCISGSFRLLSAGGFSISCQDWSAVFWVLGSISDFF